MTLSNMVFESNVEDSASSSSDSESEDEYAGDNSAGGAGGVLTLIDDECSLIAPPPPMIGEGEGEGEGYEEEGEGEGGESGTERQIEIAAEKKKEDEKAKKKKKKKKKLLYICTVSCKYESVRRVSKRCSFKDVGEDEDWNVYWTDYSVALERVMEMKRYQKINHFPGMSEICRKDLLARNMNRMAKLFPKDYNVFPRSWCLPADYGDFQAFTRAKKNKSYIMKPESGCQGKGIWVTKNPKEIKASEHQICQQYIAKPFLIDGFKFDLRIYALVTSCDPLRIYIFKDGLARFATCKYHEPTSGNTDNQYMHLTNYAINKHSSEFVRDDDEGGSKRRITTINKWWTENGYDVNKIWSDIDDCIIKTLISCHPVLKHNYRTCFPNHVKGSACFEILGFDVLLDKKLKPYLLEVNHSPSFHTDAALDKEIKEALIYDTLLLINCGAVDKKKCIEEDKKKIKDRLFQRQNKKETKEELEQAQNQYLESLEKYEQSHIGNFRRIFPITGLTEKYDKYFQHSGSLFQETAAFKARQEASRAQREEILRKKEKMESMLRKKKEPRPESPGSRRRKPFKRPQMISRRMMQRGNERQSPFWEFPPVWRTGHSQVPEDIIVDVEGENLDGELDTSKPVEILEDEELERISALLQRDNLVRGLGIVEHVYRLLHCTPGTMGIGKQESKYQLPSEVPSRGNLTSVVIKNRYRTMGMDNKIYHTTCCNQHLTQSGNESTFLKSKVGFLPDSGALVESGKQSNKYPEYEDIPQRPVQTGEANMLSAYNYGYAQYNNNQYGANRGTTSSLSSQTGFWQRGGKNSLSAIGDSRYRVPIQQPSRYKMKQNGYSNNRSSVISDMEYKQYSQFMLQDNNTRGQDWRGDTASPGNQKRTFSAVKPQKAELVSRTLVPQARPQVNPIQTPPSIQYPFTNLKSNSVNPPGLSVVSAPAPVVSRPDIGALPNSTGLKNNRTLGSSFDPGLRSTKSQRIRGTANNIRLRQLELRESQQVVLS